MFMIKSDLILSMKGYMESDVSTQNTTSALCEGVGIKSAGASTGEATTGIESATGDTVIRSAVIPDGMAGEVGDLAAILLGLGDMGSGETAGCVSEGCISGTTCKQIRHFIIVK